MISYKYKLYRTKRTRHPDAMLREACFVWNHALALQKRVAIRLPKPNSKEAAAFVSKNLCSIFLQEYVI